MKKILSLLLIFGLSFGLLIGCASGDTEPSNESEQEQEDNQTEEAESSAYPLEITDTYDHEITLEEEPDRIVSLMPSNTEIVFALEAGDKVVGVNDFDTYPEEVNDIDTVGGMELDIEKIISLKPDLVLAHGSSVEGSQDALDQLRNADIPVYVVIDAQSIDATYDSLEEIGTLTNTTDIATEIVEDMKAGFAEIEEKTAAINDDERKSVFMEVSPEPEIFTGGENTFFQEILTVINADNAAKDHDGWVKLDPEVIVDLNPGTIITTYGDYVDNPIEQVLARDGWGEVTAIKDEAVYDVDPDLVNRPGPRLVEGAKELAEVVYPELYEE